MKGLQEVYLKGFGFDKYLMIAAKDELEKLDELDKNVVISQELVEEIKKVNRKVKALASVETWCHFARVFLTTMKKINEINNIFDLSLVTYGRGVGEMAGYLKIDEDDFVVPTAVFFTEDFSVGRVFNGFPQKYYVEVSFESIDAKRNYLKGKNADDIVRDVLKAI